MRKTMEAVVVSAAASAICTITACAAADWYVENRDDIRRACRDNVWKAGRLLSRVRLAAKPVTQKINWWDRPADQWEDVS